MRRKHHKIASMPKEIVEAVNKLLVEGWTYERIAAFLAEQGHPVGKSSVGRYSADFIGQLERVKIVKEQAKAIIDETGEPGLKMEEAAVTITLQKIMEFLLDLPDLKGEEASKVMMALARIQSSSVQREKLKILWREKVQAAAEAVEAVVKDAKSDGLSDDAAAEIRKKILGIAA